MIFMFANLSFVAAILTASSIRLEGREVEERGWFGMFASCMVVTYILWTFLCSVFCGILYKLDHKEYDSSSADYQRQTDDGGWSMWSGARPVKTKEESHGWMPQWGTHKKGEKEGKIRANGNNEDEGSLAPFECFGSENKQNDGRQGTMA